MTFLAEIAFPLQQPVAIFLLVLVIILLAPIVFKALRIPHIVGMIIAGMAVGPYGLNLLARDASFQIFGQVGILYLMFLAAVEIDMVNMKQNARKGLLFGVLTFAIPMAAGIVTSVWAFGVSWLSAALIASMYASHTLISYPIIARFGLQNSRASVIAVCSTIVAVMLALIVLAELVAVNSQGRFVWADIWMLLVLITLYAVGISYVFPKLTRWFFRKVADPVTQFIYILAMVFTASLLAQLIGLEAILGAFYAGLVLNRFIPSRSTLMSRIEFVGNAIFIPYFLIGVGMLINIRAVFDGFTVLRAAAVMSLTALGCKWLAALAGQKIFGLAGDGRRILFGLTSGKAAATIAAVMVGYGNNLISEDLMNGAVLMILICCAVASITTEQAARNLRMNITRAEIKPGNQGSVIAARQLVAVANPVTAEGIMKLAILMRHPSNKMPVNALFVRNNDDPATVATGRNALDAAIRASIGSGVEVKEIDRYDINIVSGIINVAKERDASDIVIGLHRKSNIVDTFYGSLIDGLLGSTNKMVIMSRCFIPVNTVRSLVVVVPQNAEYETGFRNWVGRVGNLASQLGCRVTFLADPATVPYIQGVIKAENYNIRHQFEQFSTWDDFLIYSAHIQEDDLMIVIGARRTSISWSTDLAQLPPFLSKYFRRQNLAVIYPEQFGAAVEMPKPIDPLAETISTAPSPILLSLNRLRALYASFRLERRRNSHHRYRRHRD